MKKAIKVPSIGESITEAVIAEWKKKDGEAVKRNDVLLLLESDKATVEVVSEDDGVLSIQAQAGQKVSIGAVVGQIDSDGKAKVSASEASPKSTEKTSAHGTPPLSPAVRRIVDENKLNPATISGTGKGGRITKEDAESASRKAPQSAPTTSGPPPSGLPTASPGYASVATVSSQYGATRRVAMSTLRKRIAERLVMAQHTAAILTTFNEIDMTAVNQLREKYKEKFKQKYGYSLGLMGFFTKACVEALKVVPELNAFIEGNDIIYNDYYNVGIAVGTERGLVVPVIRNADQMAISEVEGQIRAFAERARAGKIAIDDLQGGTFTITNGGVYGSLLSTPILNPPQSGILGMHKIEDRAVVINQKIEIRSMMYVALSYDHRIIDGKQAVTFVVKVKECIEDPERMLLEV